MVALKPPARTAAFADLALNPRAPFPGGQLDVQIQNLIDAIASTQTALSDIRRDDGRLRNRSVGPEQLAPNVGSELAEQVQRATETNANIAARGAAFTGAHVDQAQMYAQNAEAAAVTASAFLSAVNAANTLVERNTHKVINATEVVDSSATDAENWANHAEAQAGNARADQEQAAAWAEYLAGPVVNQNEAPAYIQGTPWGHGLYYQPVEGYGGVAGLWSAKWWAIYAAQKVGPWSIYYLGGWSDPPVPGSVNPDTGLKVPTPLPPGSFYYDTDSGTVYFWNGAQWVSPYALAASVTSRFLYQATSGQTVFTGADYNSAVPVVGASPSDVHLNGVRLVPTLDYTISGNALTLAAGATVNSIVQWDLLVPTSQLTPGAVHSFKVMLTGAINGTNTAFTMTYTNPSTGTQPVNVTNGAQLQVCLDGILQEPGGDYTATGNTLTMAKAPPADGHFWVVWFSNAVLTAAATAEQT